MIFSLEKLSRVFHNKAVSFSGAKFWRLVFFLVCALLAFSWFAPAARAEWVLQGTPIEAKMGCPGSLDTAFRFSLLESLFMASGAFDNMGTGLEGFYGVKSFYPVDICLSFGGTVVNAPLGACDCSRAADRWACFAGVSSIPDPPVSPYHYYGGNGRVAPGYRVIYIEFDSLGNIRFWKHSDAGYIVGVFYFSHGGFNPIEDRGGGGGTVAFEDGGIGYLSLLYPSLNYFYIYRWIDPIPLGPTNPSASCPAPGSTANVSWSASVGASYYALRVNNTADGWDGSCSSPAGDFCQDITGTSYSFPSTPGASYSWWVHACSSGGCSSAVGGSFTCIASTPSPLPSGTPSPLPPPCPVGSSISPGSSFTVTPHSWPIIAFGYLPSNPSVNEIVAFVDQTRCYGAGNVLMPCSSWTWSIQDAAYESGYDQASQNPLVKFVSSGGKIITLSVTDASGFSCPPFADSVQVGSTLPKWKEVAP